MTASRAARVSRAAPSHEGDRDYSRGAAGFWVENGEICYPVEEITIAGSLKEMFRNMVAVGSDWDERSSLRSGSILLENMKVAGN